jgi:Glu-tRNA(Gln) amidotransferase subunit E-like FAD-binding protein
MIIQPKEYFNAQELPHLDEASFEQICDELLSEKAISKDCLDTLLKLMIKRPSEKIREMIFSSIIRICYDLQIVKFVRND